MPATAKAKAKHQGRQHAAEDQLGIKSAPRQIPTTDETGLRGPRQDPQMAKSSCPQGRNRGLYISSQPKKKASQHAGTNATSSKSLTWTQNVDCVAVSTRQLTTWSLAAKTGYIHRHNKTATHMHWKIWKEFGFEVKERWYEHEPKTVTENESVTVLQALPIHTDRTIATNRPNIVLKNKKDKTCLRIDIAIPLDTNTSVKTTEKLIKYKDLEIEVERMLGSKCNSPGGYGSPWHHQEGHGNYSNKIPGNINTHELQKITLLSTGHLFRRVLSIK